MEKNRKMKMKEKITADWTKLQNDGASSAINYLNAAIEQIDKTFGEGYAKKHPELVAAFMKTAVMDYHANAIGKCIQQHTEAMEGLVKETNLIHRGLYSISRTIETGTYEDDREDHEII